MKPANTIILIIIVAILGAVAYWFLADDSGAPGTQATSSTSTTPTLDFNVTASTTPLRN